MINHTIHQPASLVIGRQLGHVMRQLLLHAVHVFIAADAVVFLQASLNERCVHGRIGREDGREVWIHADVGNNHVHVGWFYNAANLLLDFGDILIADLEPGAAGHAHVDNELAWIRSWEICPAEKRKQSQKDDGESAKYNGGCCRGPLENSERELLVPRQHPLKLFVELAFKTSKEVRIACASVGIIVGKADEVRTVKRHHRHGKEVGGEDREHDT